MEIKDQSEAEIRNLAMRQTYLEEAVQDIILNGGYTFKGCAEDQAFQMLVMRLLFDMDYDSILPEEIVDGGQDKQIDIIRIENNERENFAHIHIIQTKYRNGFGSNELIGIRNGLTWIFEKPRVEYHGLKNQALINKIDEIRQLARDYSWSSLAVSVYYVTIGDTRILTPESSSEFLQEQQTLRDTFSEMPFASFNFYVMGAIELVDLLNDTERKRRSIDIDIPIVYDVNKASLIQYAVGDTKAIVCTVRGEELARIALTDPIDAIFDLNVRPFYGSRGKVNKEIRVTCTSYEAYRFWFLNNGITMVAKTAEATLDPDHPYVRVVDAQIVNGCQTTVTIREAYMCGALNTDTRVLMRIYATENQNLIERITFTTNSQNSIMERDLRSNDSIQVDIQNIMQQRFGYFYERKNKEYRGLRGEARRRIVPNVRAAQAYLAIVRQKPSSARGQPGMIWTEYYKDIFTNAAVEDLLASFIIHSYCLRQAVVDRGNTTLSRAQREVAGYGHLHVARIAGFLLTHDKWGKGKIDAVRELIQTMTLDVTVLENAYSKASEILTGIRVQSIDSDPNPALYFKASDVEKKIGSILYSLT